MPSGATARAEAWMRVLTSTATSERGAFGLWAEVRKWIAKPLEEAGALVDSPDPVEAGAHAVAVTADADDDLRELLAEALPTRSAEIAPRAAILRQAPHRPIVARTTPSLIAVTPVVEEQFGNLRS